VVAGLMGHAGSLLSALFIQSLELCLQLFNRLADYGRGSRLHKIRLGGTRTDRRNFREYDRLIDAQEQATGYPLLTIIRWCAKGRKTGIDHTSTREAGTPTADQRFTLIAGCEGKPNIIQDFGRATGKDNIGNAFPCLNYSLFFGGGGGWGSRLRISNTRIQAANQ
jgi:hypothetical protein